MEFLKKTLRIVIAVLMLAAIYVAVQLRHQEQVALGVADRPDDDVRCCIAIKSTIQSLSSRDVGFSYELLNYYADDNGKEISFARFRDTSVWDSLSRGDIDLIVFDYDDDSVSVKEHADEVLLTVPLRGNICAAVGLDKAPLLNSFNFWLNTFKSTRTYSLMSQRFFRSYQVESIASTNSHSLSPYDDIIKRYSSFSGLDWVLVSALAYQESRYYMGTQSGTAHGLMQIKPTTANHYGVHDVYDPELNIKAGTLHLQYLMRLYRDEGMDSLNVIKFALAAYNAGEGRIEQCRAHAAEAGYNSNDWDQVALSLSSHPTFVGEQTINYVDDILYRYRQYKELL
ncbi:MAG: transglycosylase SLT domain-containing protein [Bacteroidales bacterium]|nr:transglycosylase SLT domain-containing protein [Bacteroidales bacterium]